MAVGVTTDQCWRAPRRVSSSFPPRIQPGPPAWPTRLAGPGPADAGVAFVHGAKEAMEEGPLTAAWWRASRRVSSSFPPLHPPWPTPWPWPTRLADPKSGCERHEGEHVVVLGRDQGHHVQVEGHVRRRWEPEAVDARADAHEVGFVRPTSCPPITDRNRGAVLRFEGTKSDASHHYHHTRPFACFQPARVPFRSASSLPVAPFPLGVRRASVS